MNNTKGIMRGNPQHRLGILLKLSVLGAPPLVPLSSSMVDLTNPPESLMDSYAESIDKAKPRLGFSEPSRRSPSPALSPTYPWTTDETDLRNCIRIIPPSLKRNPGEGFLKGEGLPTATCSSALKRIVTRFVPDAIIDSFSKVRILRGRQFQQLMQHPKDLHKLSEFIKRHKRLINDTNLPNFEGMSPFHYALREKKWGAIRLMLRHGASATKTTNNKIEPVVLLVKPLHKQTGYNPNTDVVLKIMQKMQKKGAEFLTINSQHKTLLHRAVTCAIDTNNQIAIIKALGRMGVGSTANKSIVSLLRFVKDCNTLVPLSPGIAGVLNQPIESVLPSTLSKPHWRGTRPKVTFSTSTQTCSELSKMNAGPSTGQTELSPATSTSSISEYSSPVYMSASNLPSVPNPKTQSLVDNCFEEKRISASKNYYSDGEGISPFSKRHKNVPSSA